MMQCHPTGLAALQPDKWGHTKECYFFLMQVQLPLLTISHLVLRVGHLIKKEIKSWYKISDVYSFNFNQEIF